MAIAAQTIAEVLQEAGKEARAMQITFLLKDALAIAGLLGALADQHPDFAAKQLLLSAKDISNHLLEGSASQRALEKMTAALDSVAAEAEVGNRAASSLFAPDSKTHQTSGEEETPSGRPN
jgi:hypothetical protein